MKIKWSYYEEMTQSELLDELIEKGLDPVKAQAIIEDGILYSAEIELDTEKMKVKLLSTNGLESNIEK